MQMVIDICKDDFDAICMQARMVEDTGSLFGRIRKSIFHCTPLPKGHGDLVDYEELKNNVGEYGAYAEATLSHIKPKIIIEADKEESER